MKSTRGQLLTITLAAAALPLLVVLCQPRKAEAAPPPANAPQPDRGSGAAERASAKPGESAPPPVAGLDPGAGSGNENSTTLDVPPELVQVAREARERFVNGSYRESERLFEQLLAKAPKSLYVLSHLGVVCFRAGKLQRAEELLKQALVIAPRDSFCHCTLGILYYSQEKDDAAINELASALAINSRNAVAHNYLGIAAKHKGWDGAALKELEAATDFDPNYADAFFNLAVILATQQPPDKDRARRNYQRALELGAEHNAALDQLIKN